MTSDKIVIKKIRAWGFHGVLPEENVSGQFFFVSLEATLGLSTAGTTDDLTNSVDYAELVALVKKIVGGKPPVRLIETLAEKIAKEILAKFPRVEKIYVEVHKPAAPVGAEVEDLYVAVERERSDISALAGKRD